MLKETKEVFKQLGCKGIVEAVEHGFCPSCERPISKDEFQDESSKKEFEISGLCLACQNIFFTELVEKVFPRGRYPDKALKVFFQ